MSSNGGIPETNRVLGFLKEYKVLECACCQIMFGFQHRATGVTYCIGGCHEKGQAQQSLLGFTNPITLLSTTPPNIPFVSPNPLVNPVKANAVSATVANGPVPAKVAPEVIKAPKPAAPTAEKLVAPTVKSVDSVDSRLKPAAAPVSAPVAAAPISTPAKTVKEEAKPVPPKPAPAKPANLFPALQYSKNLVCPNAQVKVQFMWNPLTFQVVADADEGPLAEFQAEVGIYASKASKMERPPVKDEVVIGYYGEGAEAEPYRARVRKVNGDKCDIEFIDYGDATECHYKDLIPANDAVMKAPLYGMSIKLAKIPEPPADFTFPTILEDDLYGQSYFIDPVQKNVKPVPGQAGPYEVRLWDLPRDGTLNEKLVLHISSALRALEEERELEHLTSTNSHFRINRQFIEEYMKNEALVKKIENLFIFKLDNADFPYTIRDLPLIKPDLVQGVKDVEIAAYEGLCDVIVRPVGGNFDASRNSISERLENWMQRRNKDELNRLKSFAPKTEEMCVVQWPSWEIFYEEMRSNFNEYWFEDENFYKRVDLNICFKDYKRHTGKWFRAACVKVHVDKGEVKKKSPEIYEMFLVDWGDLTLIPRKFIYRMPHRFMIDYQMSLFTTVVLDDIDQYDYDSSEVDEKWEHLLLPGMKIKVKIVWMYDEMNLMRLINPSEEQFNLHFRKAAVQGAIEKQKRLYNN